MKQIAFILIVLATAGCSRNDRVKQESGPITGLWMSHKMEDYSITLQQYGSTLRGTGQTHSDVVNTEFSFPVSGLVEQSTEMGVDIVTLVYSSSNHPSWNQTNIFKIARWEKSKTRCLKGIMGTADILLDHEELMKAYQGAQEN